MAQRRVTFRVSFLLPPSATIADARAYIVDAVSTMKGCYRPPGGYDDTDPGDAMWNLDRATVKVTRIKEAKS